MTITVEELRRKYPEPIKTPTGQLAPAGTYCVGGALLRELGFRAHLTRGPASNGEGKQYEETGRSGSVGTTGRIAATAATNAQGEPLEVGLFPNPEVLRDGLMQANPILTIEAATTFAETIARKNDTGNFETAWGLLGDALTWTEEWTDADDAALREFSGLSA